MADEVIKLEAITAGYTLEALEVDAQHAVEEYSVWGGIPRYWELRRDYPDLKSAIKNLILDTQGMQIISTFLREKLSTTYPLKGRIINAAMVYPESTMPIISFDVPKRSLRYNGKSGVNI